MRHTSLRTEHVEYMPETLEQGVIYVSKKYEIAIHLCACGCGSQTPTPFGSWRDSWTLTESERGATLRPSIGNWQMPCRSHYWLTDGEVQWC